MVIKQKKHTLSIDEKYVLYENDSTYLYLLDTVTQQKTPGSMTVHVPGVFWHFILYFIYPFTLFFFFLTLFDSFIPPRPEG